MSKLAIYAIRQPSFASIQFFSWNFSWFLTRILGSYGYIFYIIPNIFYLQFQTSTQISLVSYPLKKNINNFLGLFFTLFLCSLRDVSFTYKTFLEMRGVGFKIFRKQTKIFLEVGCSHSVSLKIPEGLFVKITDRKNTKIMLRGLHRHRVNVPAMTLQLTSFPNEYTLKGVHYTNKWMKKKPGKQAQQK